jgi:hypothetical protein
VAEDRDSPTRPLLGHDVAQRQHPAHRRTGGAQPAQLDIQCDRGERAGQRIVEAGGAENREARIDAVVELPVQPVGRHAAQR